VALVQCIGQDCIFWGSGSGEINREVRTRDITNMFKKIHFADITRSDIIRINDQSVYFMNMYVNISPEATLTNASRQLHYAQIYWLVTDLLFHFITFKDDFYCGIVSASLFNSFCNEIFYQERQNSRCYKRRSGNPDDRQNCTRLRQHVCTKYSTYSIQLILLCANDSTKNRNRAKINSRISCKNSSNVTSEVK